MQRIPEPELMNEAQQVYAYANADFSEPHNAFVDGIENRFPGLQPKHVLDLGCGSGDVCERMAAHFKNSRFLAVDGAESMLVVASQRAQDKGLDSRIDYRHVYLPDKSLTGDFDLITSNSLLHHLHDPMVLWQTIKQCGIAGTAVYIMDLTRPASAEAARQLVDAYAADEPEVLQHDFYHSLLAAYEPDEIMQQLKVAGLSSLDVIKTSDRHVVVCGRL